MYSAEQIEIKVFETNGRWLNYDGGSHCIFDYVYNVYYKDIENRLILVHSVTVRSVHPKDAIEMFAGLTITDQKER